MHYRDKPQGFFLRCVGDQVFPHKSKPQRPRTEVGATVAAMGKRHKPANGVENLQHDPVGCVRTLLRNEIAYFVEAGEGFRVEHLATAHSGRLRRAIRLPLFSSQTRCAQHHRQLTARRRQ